MRLDIVAAAAVVAGFAGCSVVNVADDPLDPDPSPTGGGSVGGGGGSGTTSSSTTSSHTTSSSTTASGGSGGAGGACDDGVTNGDETDVDCGGSCEPCAVGLGCAVPADCSSGFCPAEDGICCATACDDLCEACAEAKTGAADGTCGAIVAATDPDLDCPAGPVSGCDISGAGCDGSGACLLYDANTVCLAPSCVNAIATAAGYCNGSGSCLPGSQTPCGAYACDAGTSTCKTSCGSNLDCTAPATCNIGAGTCGSTVTFDTHNFAGYTEYPLDTDTCACCGTTTTAQTANAFCVLAGMSSAVSWTTGMINGTNCYCWDCITVDTWASNCCGGQASRPMILTVTCQ